MGIQVLLVDDHTVVRRGLRRILESHPGIAVVGEAGDGAQALSAALELEPQVILMDIGLPDQTGIEATRQILSRKPAMRVVMLSMHADAQYIEQSRAAGACGYLVKDADDRVVVAAVFAVAQGEQFFSAGTATASSMGACAPDRLSGREREVLALIASAASNREIGQLLGISLTTVEAHRKHIIEKLDLHSTADLVRYAIRNGIGEP